MSNIRAVAKQAGLSVATVSRAFSQPDKVSQQARERVFRAAEEVGYRPNSLARIFRSNRTDTIVVMVPDLANSWFSRVLLGVEQAAVRMGFATLVSDTRDDPAIEKSCIELVHTRRADGIIQLGASSREELLGENDDGLAFVHAIENPDNTRSPSVCIDNVAASEKMVDYLLSLGHRRIGVIAGQQNSDITRRRLQGYTRAMERAGLHSREEDIAFGDYSLESGARAAHGLLTATPDLTALFCMSDDIAIGAMSAARELGLDLPGALSITGFDNIEFGKFCHPTLTTVTQPAEEIGETAMNLMYELLSGEISGDRHRVLTTELVLRRSTVSLE